MQMSNPEHTTDRVLISQLAKCEKIEIPHPLIKSLFSGKGLGAMSEYKGVPINPMDCSHYHKSFSRIYLTYLTQRLFQFQRLPGFEEEAVYTRDEKLKDLLASITEDEIQEHMGVLEKLYLHTQSELRKTIGKDTIRLYRGFREPMNTMVSLAVRRALEVGDEVARVYSNTLDFFAAAHGGHSWGASISIDVPIQNVLIAHQTVHGFSETDQDIFVINRSPTGFYDIPLERFEIEEVCKVAWSDFNRIANGCTARDHRAIFADMMRNLPPERHIQYDFEYNRGSFELWLSTLGRKIDQKLRGPSRWYSWNQKS